MINCSFAVSSAISTLKEPSHFTFYVSAIDVPNNPFPKTLIDLNNCCFFHSWMSALVAGMHTNNFNCNFVRACCNRQNKIHRARKNDDTKP